VKRILVVIGTRPEAIKMAPVIRELRARAGFQTILLSTAQHREMLDQVLSAFGLEADIDLDAMRPSQDLGELTGRLIEGVQRSMVECRPDLVITQGDTTTVLATGLAALYCRVPLAHVEAGLRSGDLQNPYPEEANRRVTSVLAELHLAPTPLAARALVEEGIAPERVVVTGNTVVDALELTLAAPFDWRESGLPDLPDDARLLLVTSHRRESWGQELENICLAIRELVVSFRGLHVLYPVHLNPRVRATVSSMLADVDRVHLTPPLDYPTFVNVMRRSTLILTDSGGVQEEAPTLRKPLLVLRQVTERPEAFRAGLSKVIGTSPAAIVNEVTQLLTDHRAYATMTTGANPFGDGRAAQRIVRAVERWSCGVRPLLEHDEQFAVEPMMAYR
jgi:UDP-N-acetylglucosamine 2-epimerase (non-hydrolysing)